MKYFHTLYLLKGEATVARKNSSDIEVLPIHTLMHFRGKPDYFLIEFIVEKYLNNKGLGFGFDQNIILNHTISTKKLRKEFLWRNLLSDITGIKWNDILINNPHSYLEAV